VIDVDIYALTDKILGEVFDDSFFRGMPEFGENDEPDVYAVYTLREKPSFHASDTNLAKTYWVEVSVFSALAEPTLYEQVEDAFSDRDFMYDGGTDAGNKNIYPYKTQYVMDFTLDVYKN